MNREIHKWLLEADHCHLIDGSNSHSVGLLIRRHIFVTKTVQRVVEEPVSSDHLADLRRVRNHAPSSMEIAAGEYGYDSIYFRRMLEAESVDVLQLDATRCKGFTGFLEGAAVAASFGCPLSAHCAPSLHMHAGCAVQNFRHVEYFHDHVRVEEMLFDGFIVPKDGRLTPDRSRPGLGLVFKHKDAEQFATWGKR